MDAETDTAPSPRRTKRRGTPSPQRPRPRLRPQCTARTPHRRQRTLPLRSADRRAKLDPAPRHPRPALRTRTRLGRPRPRSPRAREKAVANRKLAREGGDPLADKRRIQGVPTFAEAARRVIEQKQGGWKNAEQIRAWRNSLVRYAFPRIGTRPVSEVTSADVLAILSPIWHAKPVIAKAVRQRLHAVLEWAIAMNLRSDNPADRVRPVLGPQRNIVEHMRALPHREVAAAVATVRASGEKPVDKLAFELLVLTAARSGEVRGATWDEIDTAGRVWTLSAARMKMKRDHRVPLCGRAIEILREARMIGDASPLVFTDRGGMPLDTKQFRRLLERCGIACVPHGFRSSFRDWAAEETDHPREVIEAALAHVVQNKGRSRLRPLRPVRAAAAAHERLGRLP